MSDTFNHCLDAYEDLWSHDGYERYRESTPRFIRNNCYDDIYEYRRKDQYIIHKFESLYMQTEKAYCFKLKEDLYWIPKKLCKSITIIDGKKRPCRAKVWSKSVLRVSENKSFERISSWS
jgi:hypothetical protein